MNFQDHHADLMHVLDISGYPSKHLDERAVVEYEDDDGSYDPEKVLESCGYLTDVLISHLEQVEPSGPQVPKRVWNALNGLIGQVGEDEYNGRCVDDETLEDCDAISKWLDRNRPPVNVENNPLASWDRSRLESLVYHFVHCCHQGDTECCDTADRLYPELFPEEDESDE